MSQFTCLGRSTPTSGVVQKEMSPTGEATAAFTNLNKISHWKYKCKDQTRSLQLRCYFHFNMWMWVLEIHQRHRHASRSKHLGKILGNRGSEFVTNAKICHFVTSMFPKLSRVSDGDTLVMCWEWCQQACPSRWALEQLEEHANGQTRYFLECEHSLALNGTEKL